MRPSVDIVIAARNEERDIAACLQSLRSQSYRGAVKIWVAVDADSRDKTALLALQHRAFLVAGERGAAAGRNRAWRLGEGELVAFVDAHCTAVSGWLEALVKKQQDTGAGGVQGHIDFRFTGRATLELNQESAYAWLKTGNCVYRREALERVGGFDEALPACEDVDLSWRVLWAGYPLAFSLQAVVTHLDRGCAAQHLRRSFWQGVGAGQLARRFRLDAPAFPGWRANARQWGYWLGSCLGRWQRATPYDRPRRVHKWVRWSETLSLRPATGVVWWHNEAEVILLDARRRVGLSGGGEIFWRCLYRGWTRERILKALPRAVQDLDPWVETMLAEGWLES